jgi:hypothetical protein
LDVPAKATRHEKERKDIHLERKMRADDISYTGKPKESTKNLFK